MRIYIYYTMIFKFIQAMDKQTKIFVKILRIKENKDTSSCLCAFTKDLRMKQQSEALQLCLRLIIQ